MLFRFYQNLENYLKPNKVLVIYGPRQAGKTTLVQQYLARCNLKYRLDSGDNIKIQNLLSSQDFNLLQEYVAGIELLVVDEAQKIPNIGIALKILVDNVPDIKIIVTGSSSFELAGQIGEPLTGRKTTLTLFTIAQIELAQMQNNYDLKQKLAEYLIFGSYPEVITATTKQKKIDLLEEIMHSYLLKDILELERIKGSKILIDLLRMLAYQIGKEVSISELAAQLHIDTKTVARYLDLLEKAFVIFNLRGFSKNLRKEITKMSRYYFYDNGLRNAIIANFNELEIRNDVGELWENFLFIERLKKCSYQNIYSNRYFWRTWDQKEIDLVEEREGKLFGYEIKWGEKKLVNAPKLWFKTYPEASFEVINRQNYLDFII
jgi:uncharacterized protein